MEQIKFFKSQAEWRSWLKKNHDKVDEIWIGFYKINSGKKGITYKEALDEALCFGWIDGVRYGVDELSYKNRFTPRRPKSNWSDVNIKHINELIELGLVEPSGLKAFKEGGEYGTSRYSFEAKTRELAPDYVKKFMQNKTAWEFYNTQPPSYRKTVNWWVMSAKQEETRLKRLAVLIQDSENKLRIKQMRR
ncbi:MAG TPA: YdeI/OmpD-associated family protein [Ignavibacteriales bacterium]|nr:YdeI/OmpD-associated family protein [Ignavibacteriales bacterium]